MQKFKTMTPELTHRVWIYQSKKKKKQYYNGHYLINYLAYKTYNYVQTYTAIEDNEKGEFLDFIIPKLTPLPDNFDYQGKPFESYLYMTIKLQFNTFLKIRTVHKINDFVLNSGNYCENLLLSHSYEMMLKEPTPYFSRAAKRILRVDRQGIIHEKSNKKRLHYLMIKEAHHINDILIQRIAETTDTNSEWLFSCIRIINKRVPCYSKHKTTLLRQKNQIFFSLCKIYVRISLASNKKEQEKLLVIYEKYKNRLTVIQQKIDSVMSPIPNQDIAKIFNVPKGTVDTSIYYLKKHYKRAASY